MSTMNSIRLAFHHHQDGEDDEKGGPPVWVIALVIVGVMALVAGLGDAGMLPSFAADDAGSILFDGT